MPIRDVAAMNRSLDNDYGATRGPNAPDAHLLCLWVGDPMLPEDSAEQAGPGYARLLLSNDGTTWAPSEDGMKSTHVGVEMAAPTGEWPEVVTHWALIDAADGVTMWDSAPLTEPLSVTAASDVGPVVQPTIFYGDAVDEPE